MSLARHVARVVFESLQFGIATRQPSLLIAVLVGLVLVALALGAQVAAPLAVYPFA